VPQQPDYHGCYRTPERPDIRRTWLVVKNGAIYQPAELHQALGVRP
jgi:hypothetical protein